MPILTIKSVDGNVITLDDDTTRDVADGAAVTLNGKAAKLADLKKGDSVSLTGDPASAVAATR